MGRPVVEHFNTNVFLNTVIKGEDLFSTVDPDGDQIRFFRVEDYQSDPTGGFFRLNGVAMANGTQFRVEADELRFLEYVSGSRIGWEGFRVIAVDVKGEFSTDLDSGRIYTVRENRNRPRVQNLPVAALADEATPLAPFIRGFDPDGYPITQYFIRDRWENAGFISIDGEAVPQGEYRLVKTEDLDTVRYHSAGGAFSELLDIFSYDGEFWSERQSNTVTTTANVNRPVAQFTRGDAVSRESIPMSPLTNVTDDDGNSIKWFEFWNTSPHAVHGELVFKGEVLARKQWHRVNANELDQLFFQAPNRDFIQQIRYRGHDGKFQSNNGTISITTDFVEPPIQPTVSNPGFIFDQQLVEYRLDSLFSRTDGGVSQTARYQIYDGNGFDQRSARFEQDDNELAALTIHDFTAAEVNSSVRFKTGDFNNRHVDDILVRVQNSDGLWTKWEKLTVRTDPEHFTALDNGATTWNDFDIPRDPQGRLQLTYSFMQDFPDYDPPGNGIEDGDIPNHFSIFTQAARESIRRTFDEYEKITNVKFDEVSDLSTNVFGGRGGIYRLGNYGEDFGGTAAISGGISTEPSSGDLWYDRFNLGEVIVDADDNYVSHVDPQLTPYTFGFYGSLHLLMNSFGFTDVDSSDGGTGILPPPTQNSSFSVVDNGALRPEAAPTTPQLYDIEALHRVYGVNASYNSGDDLYSLATEWNEQDLFFESLWDSGGIDTLSLEGSDPTIGGQTGNAIDLSPGGFSSFNGLQDNVSIAFRAIIENAVGSDLNDTLLGNHVANSIVAGAGDDTIEGRAGDDSLTGGVGSDIFIFGVGDGNDTIDEQKGAGRDRIRLTEFPTLDSLENDIRFSLDGRDLIIDLKLDNSDISEGSIRIKDHVWGRSRIEILELNGTAIDLVNLTQQITPLNDTFQITSDTSILGNLVAPV